MDELPALCGADWIWTRHLGNDIHEGWLQGSSAHQESINVRLCNQLLVWAESPKLGRRWSWQGQESKSKLRRNIQCRINKIQMNKSWTITVLLGPDCKICSAFFHETIWSPIAYHTFMDFLSLFNVRVGSHVQTWGYRRLWGWSHAQNTSNIQPPADS